MRRVYVKGMTQEEAGRAMRSDPEYIKHLVLNYLYTSPGGDMRRVYVEGMTQEEAGRAMRSDPEYRA